MGRFLPALFFVPSRFCTFVPYSLPSRSPAWHPDPQGWQPDPLHGIQIPRDGSQIPAGHPDFFPFYRKTNIFWFFIVYIYIFEFKNQFIMTTQISYRAQVDSPAVYQQFLNEFLADLKSDRSRKIMLKKEIKELAYRYDHLMEQLKKFPLEFPRMYGYWYTPRDIQHLAIQIKIATDNYCSL